MSTNIQYITSCLFLLFLFSCKQEVTIEAVADFTCEVTGDKYSIPVSVQLTNKSTAAQFYKWTFEGAVPAQSDQRNPGTIIYYEAGTYTIQLEAWNDNHRAYKEFVLQTDSVIAVDFSLHSLINDFAPAQYTLTNHSKGATTYAWSFENGTPSTSAERNPGTLTFPEGEHTITLLVGNGRETHSLNRTITIKPALQAAFTIDPYLENNDYEAPLTATLNNQTISGLNWQWTTDGGIVSNDTTHSPYIHFPVPGTYTVTLTANNHKESRTVSQTITVKPNRNLRTFTDVKLGINTAHKNTGCYFSTRLQKVFTANDDLTEAGQYIDIVFFGLNQHFWKNQFLSPDSVQHYTFAPIPGAQNCHIVNSQELIGYNFTTADFDAMTDDTPLQPLNIRATKKGLEPFSDTLPRVVLIRTADGRKGAIKIKQMVAAGQQSYIVADIKIMKN